MTESPADSRPAIAAAIVISAGKVLMVRRRVAEGQLSWQFPAGEVESNETGEQAAARETKEETGITVSATKTLGERIHPNTGRTMIYVACELITGTAHVADQDELDAVEWCDQATLTDHVPYPLFGPVQDYLTAALAEQPSPHQLVPDHQPLAEDGHGATPQSAPASTRESDPPSRPVAASAPDDDTY